MEVTISEFKAKNTYGIAINSHRVTKTKPYGMVDILSTYVVDEKDILIALDREQKKAHWNEDDIGYDPFLTCSECGLSLSKGDYTREEWQEVFNYCPCCGADMREAKE